MNSSIDFKINGCAFKKFPTGLFYGKILKKDIVIANIPKISVYSGDWGGDNNRIFIENSCRCFPTRIEILFLSITEYTFYYLKNDLRDVNNVQGLENLLKLSDVYLLIGMAPYGGIAVWVRGFNKSVLVDWLKGSEIEVAMADFHPVNPDTTLKEYCDYYINNDSLVKGNLEKNGLPPRNLFDKYMQQFTYRYQPLFEKWNDGEEVKWQKYKEDEIRPEFEYIEESLYDGTHDKLHDDGLLKYHKAGKPKKLAIKWHIKKSEYTAYFWFEDEKICSIFDRFYGAHPDTKTDFIIRIDAEQKKYELALFRQGLKEPQIIPEDAYQLLVFKNKFEDYRSDNYNQERGAWIW